MASRWPFLSSTLWLVSVIVAAGDELTFVHMNRCRFQHGNTRKVEQGEVGPSRGAGSLGTGAETSEPPSVVRSPGRGWAAILPSGLSKIEQGDRRVDVDDLVALADALGTVPGALLQGPLARPVGLTENRRRSASCNRCGPSIVRLAGMTRYQVIEWMNMADGVRRMMEQDPSGEVAAKLAAALGRDITDNTGLTDIPYVPSKDDR